MKWLFAALLVLQAHFAASYLVPLDREAQATFGGLLRWAWPWSIGDGGLLGWIPASGEYPVSGIFLAGAAALMFVLAALAVVGRWVSDAGLLRSYETAAHGPRPRRSVGRHYRSAAGSTRRLTARLNAMKPSWHYPKILRALIIVVALVAILLVGAWLYGAYRWNSETQELRARLDAARTPVRPQTFDFRELEGLPAPVQRYFRAVLGEEQPMVAGVRVRHTGTFNMGETTDNWKPFTSDQQVVTQRAGFDWNGRVAMMPGVPVRVHDAYVAGEGTLHASLLGLFTVVDMHATRDVAEGELMRFFAEAAWYPTALLPSQGVRWEAVDDHSAYATLEEGDITITMLFTFNEEGLIDTVRAGARGRAVGDEVIPTPWQGRFWNYEERGGMRVPLDGEVAWLLPEGEKPYWRGHITEIRYQFAR